MLNFFEYIRDLVLAHPYISVLLSTFVSEDAAYFYCLFAAHLSRFKLGLAYVAGVILGDVGLYCCGGLPKKFARMFQVKQNMHAFKKIKHVESMDLWLMMTRFIPGTRVVTYSYLGYTQYSLMRFIMLLLLSTVLQVCVGFIFVDIFSHIFNIESMFSRLMMALYAMLCSILLFKSITLLMKWKKQSLDVVQVKWIAFKRLIYKEFWPSWLMYTVFIPGFIYISLKHRCLSCFIYCNPGIKNSGFVGENKEDMFEVLKAIPERYKLKQITIVYQQHECIDHIFKRLSEHGIHFPCYAKPLLGHKGFQVKRIENHAELEQYYKRQKKDFLIQEFCAAQEEMGLYFMKHAHSYEIFSITKKIFPCVKGDGQSSLKQLIMQDPYYHLFAPSYFKTLHQQWNDVLPVNESKTLTFEGNHSQGCIFQNGMHMATPLLRQALNTMMAHVNGVNIGRFDLKYTLNNGDIDPNSLKIIELNGASGEPTHIYDRKTSLFAMYQAIYQQYDYILEKGKENINHPQITWSLASVLKDWYHYLKQAKA